MRRAGVEGGGAATRRGPRRSPEGPPAPAAAPARGCSAAERGTRARPRAPPGRRARPPPGRPPSRSPCRRLASPPHARSRRVRRGPSGAAGGACPATGHYVQPEPAGTGFSGKKAEQLLVCRRPRVGGLSTPPLVRDLQSHSGGTRARPLSANLVGASVMSRRPPTRAAPHTHVSDVAVGGGLSDGAARKALRLVPART